MAPNARRNARDNAHQRLRPWVVARRDPVGMASGAQRKFSTSFYAWDTSRIAGDPPRQFGVAMAVRSTSHWDTPPLHNV